MERKRFQPEENQWLKQQSQHGMMLAVNGDVRCPRCRVQVRLGELWIPSTSSARTQGRGRDQNHCAAGNSKPEGSDSVFFFCEISS
jgi:hypothetical protein